jgi:hypothetical protein
MKLGNAMVCALALTSTAMVAMPSSAFSQTRAQLRHRQQTKNDWRNIAAVAGGLSVLGLLQHDNTLFFGGLAGALYSANRYEQDRKSQSRTQRLRASYFSKPYFYRNGTRYDRRVTYKNGRKYYYFAKH